MPMNLEDFRNVDGAEDDEVRDLLRTYEDIETYYREVLAAMYVADEPVEPVRNSAEVTLSLGHESSTAFEVK